MPPASELEGTRLSDILTTAGMATSAGDAKRLIDQGAVRIDDQPVAANLPAACGDRGDPPARQRHPGRAPPVRPARWLNPRGSHPVIAKLRDLLRRIPTSLYNVLNAGLPWRRVVSLCGTNNWRKLRFGQGCCGNLGQPGC